MGRMGKGPAVMGRPLRRAWDRRMASERDSTPGPVWERMVSRWRPVSLEIWRRLKPWDRRRAASLRREGLA
jgi:hypothetical protein